MRLNGKVALVTGANSGIGLATAKRFAEEGALVFMTGRRKAELDAAVAEVGMNARGVRGDVSNLEDLDKLYSIIKAEAGHLDIVFANAGGGEFSTLEAVTEDHFDRTFSINVKGTLFTVQKALPLLRDKSSIILTGSTAASKGIPAFGVYGATKAAVRSFARSWILELSSRAIRVNVLVPGATSTPGWHALGKTEEERDEMMRLSLAGIPLGRLGEPVETANAAVFLASDESSFVNGTELFVDGGSAQI